MSDPSFGALLRGWRDRLDPADAGYARSARSRAPGLRREELAELAGLSVEYVLRLEQGRATNPSGQVVSAVARALRLTTAERDQLFRAAGLLPPRDRTVGTHVPPSVRRLVGRLGDLPIGVFAADWSLLWWNDMWTALHGDPSGLPPAERNLARALFGTGAGRWHLRPVSSAAGPYAFETAIVADLREAVARYPADPGLAALVDGLRTVSPFFGELWAAADMAQLTGDLKTISHPELGDVTLDCDVLTVPGADLRIVTYTAAPATSGADQLERMRTSRFSEAR
ncbi:MULTISPECIES: MmyB family transcriptional regulator [Catenuloplanes]|uniref:Transcriptional regulator with XRE-family HTH domain n=1 Tax=Catenuloplanes niger TaxID=587534 RepID=A0AAE3ZXT0_9ACTN|nr:helix-turn-helix domain-containing protein [Catenuloplanes niger]MDR7327159.1 transcriptional regulator with XRE-family HTH domain [Catenuloplanes niger]